MSIGVDSVIYPLAPVQAEIWLAQQIDPHSAVYNVAQFVAIDGLIEPAIFEAALRQVVEEAQSVRLQFINSGDEVQQFIGSSDWALAILDFSTETHPQAAAEAWMKADYQKPIDLSKDSLFGYALLKVESDKFLWYQRYHHIAMDGFGRALVAQRVADVYNAMVQGKEIAPSPFGSISQLLQNEAEYRASEQWAEDKDYWLKRCADLPEPVTLASCSADACHYSLRETAYFDTSYLQGLDPSQSFVRHVAALVIASMAAYLYRLTGMEDVVIGFPVTARNAVARSIPGMVTTTLPIRLTVLPTMSLTSLMEQAAQEIRDTLKHQRYPGEVLRRDLALAPYQRLFGVNINIVPFNQDLSFGGHSSTLHTFETGPVEDLSVRVCPQSNNAELRIEFNANPARYTPEEVITHQRRFLRFLEILATNQAQSISDIDLLDAAERQQLLVDWNDTVKPYPQGQCLHQLFEAQVERTPEAIALVYEDQELSYAELNARANRLAHQLIELGVGPDKRVAICVARSPAMVVGLLAILKAGGSYVPLDPAYPSERLTYIFANAAPVILLVDAVGRTALDKASLSSITVLDPNELPESAINNPHVPELNSSHLAYVIYTSGSTGTPKGVMVEHRNIVNLAQAHPAYYEIGPSSRVLQFASPSFDTSVSEIFMALSCGASLSLPSNIVRQDLNELWNYIEKYAITHATLTPALLQDGTILPNPETQLTLILAGEPSSVALVKSLTRAHTVFNAYGPTEATVCATAWRCSPNFNEEVISIGRPLANTRIYVLDAYGQPVPLGIVGELYIGGVGVARGYLNRPELTAERFLPDPFSNQVSARMYKTGDLVRYLPDGNVKFLGRNDHQIKIRGFRIEPGEIEARLIEHPLVHEAAVLALGEGSEKRLIAYVVAEAVEQLASMLREHLAPKLSDYMMPSAFVRLDALPLTPNGKLDRQALPTLSNEDFAHQAYEAPQGEIEITLVNIWAEVLQAKKISRYDDFFALGGHSILAMRMISHARKRGIEISLGMVFEAPTIMELAKRLLKSDNALINLFDILFPIKSTGSRPPLFCIHHGGGLSWCYASLSRHLDADQPIYGLQARGFDGVSPLAETVDAMVADYIKLIRRLQPKGPYHLLGWSLGGSIAHSIAVQLEQQDEKVVLLALLDSRSTYSDDSIDLQEELKFFYGEAMARYGDETMPTEETSFWERSLNIHKNNVRLAQTLSPLIYSGDMLYFRATIPQGESKLRAPLDLWKPYVLGNIEIRDIHSTHNYMDEQAPMAEIGLILAQKLDQLQETQPSQIEVAI